MNPDGSDDRAGVELRVYESTDGKLRIFIDGYMIEEIDPIEWTATMQKALINAYFIGCTQTRKRLYDVDLPIANPRDPWPAPVPWNTIG